MIGPIPMSSPCWWYPALHFPRKWWWAILAIQRRKVE
jgi:hypothetical protein